MKRIYHTWDEWECYPAGFYNPKPATGDLTADQCRQEYARFLRNTDRFAEALQGVLRDWPNSCEHYLTNETMNRIAWLGQAAMCYATGIPSEYRGGYFRLTKGEQQRADLTALDVLNQWLTDHGEEPCTIQTAQSRTKANLY